MEKIIVSNRKWFQTYAWFRLAIFLLVLILFLLEYFEIYQSPLLFKGSFAIYLMIIIFDFIQKPSFLEITEGENGINIKQYAPDTGLFFYLTPSRIKTIEVQNGDQVSYIFTKGFMPFLNKIHFAINGKKGQFYSRKTNVGWMHSSNLKELNEVFSNHNTRK